MGPCYSAVSFPILLGKMGKAEEDGAVVNYRRVSYRNPRPAQSRGGGTQAVRCRPPSPVQRFIFQSLWSEMASGAVSESASSHLLKHFPCLSESFNTGV